MRRASLPLVILAAVALAALLTWIALSTASFGNRPPRAEPGATRAETVTRSLPPFSRIDVSGTTEMALVQGAAEGIAIAAGRRQGRVEAEVRGDTLYVRSDDGGRWWDVLFGGAQAPPQVVVTFRELSAIDAAGTVRLSATAIKVPELKIAGAGGTAIRIDDLQAGKLRLSGAGALKADVAGRVTEQVVTISGAGEYRGGRLASDDATVTVAGAAQVVVNAAKTLSANISGAGSVDYVGDPKVTERVSGAGRVRRRDR